MSKYILPKGYLSYSAMTCWQTNQLRFRREYFEQGDKLDTKYLRFGKGIAKMIEEGKHKTLLPDLIVYEFPEFEIQCNVKGVEILSFIDNYDPTNNVFREIKTGKHAWTQSKVQKHEQLLFYATALKWATGKMPEYCDLDWIETKEGPVAMDDFWHENERMINTTGRIVSFRREFDERELERMEDLIVKCATDISEAYVKFIEEI